MKKLIIALIALATLASCKKWLDVKPQTQISDDDLFKTEDGFKEAVNGMYTLMSDGKLYGREMTTGTMEVVSQGLYADALTDLSAYHQTLLYNYRDVNFLSRKDTIWKKLYSVIANANNLLDHVDNNKNLFKGNNYNLIKGEALALRGFCHFDLLRLFAASYYGKTDGPGVPYSVDFSRDAPKMYKISEVVNLLIKDLTDAKNLLSGIDPIQSAAYKVGYGTVDTATENTDLELFHQYRRTHMNYYAVCAELARVYLYAGDNVNALANALEVINAKKFPWTKQTDMLNTDNTKRDWICYKEIIFGVYAPDQKQPLHDLLVADGGHLYQTINGGDALFEANTDAGGNDLRYKTWIQLQSGSTPYYRSMKYYRDDDGNLYDLTVPCIRLGEMYYIAAEASFDKDPVTACNYYNTIRFNRNIGDSLKTTDKTEFLGALTREARKEFFCEGQMFYMYKRLNMPIIGVSGQAIPLTKAITTWAFPDDETIYANR